MSRTVSFVDWVDLLAIELTFVELYRLATPSQKGEMKATLRRLAAGISEADLDVLVSKVPNLERALNRLSAEEQDRFVPQLSNSVTELTQYLASVSAKRD